MYSTLFFWAVMLSWIGGLCLAQVNNYDGGTALAITGGIVSGIGVVLFLAIGLIEFRRRRKERI